MPGDRFVPIVTYPSRFEADLAAGLLEDEGIPVLINSDLSAVLGAGIGNVLPHGAALAVPESLVDAARDLLASAKLLGDGGDDGEDDGEPPSAA